MAATDAIDTHSHHSLLKHRIIGTRHRISCDLRRSLDPAER
jgi:hypothetical protein